MRDDEGAADESGGASTMSVRTLEGVTPACIIAITSAIAGVLRGAIPFCASPATELPPVQPRDTRLPVGQIRKQQ